MGGLVSDVFICIKDSVMNKATGACYNARRLREITDMSLEIKIAVREMSPNHLQGRKKKRNQRLLDLRFSLNNDQEGCASLSTKL